MSDDRLRRLERAWLESGAPEDQAAWLRERVRVGDLSKGRLELAASLGDPAAALALGPSAPPPPETLRAWCEQLLAQGEEVVIRATEAMVADLEQPGDRFDGYPDETLFLLEALSERLFDAERGRALLEQLRLGLVDPPVGAWWGYGPVADVLLPVTELLLEPALGVEALERGYAPLLDWLERRRGSPALPLLTRLAAQGLVPWLFGRSDPLRALRERRGLRLGRTRGLARGILVLDPAEGVIVTNSRGEVERWGTTPPGRRQAWTRVREDLYSLTVAPTRRGFLTGGLHGTVARWELDRPDEPAERWSWRSQVNTLAFLPDGRLAGGDGQGNLVVWDPPGAADPRVLPAVEGTSLRSLAVAPDGSCLAGCGRGGVWLWSLPELEPTALPLPEADPSVLDFAGTSDRLAVGCGDGRILLLRLPDGTPLQELKGHHGIYDLETSPDGRLLASTGDTAVVVWDLERAEERRRWEGSSIVLTLGWTPDSRAVISGARSGALRLHPLG